MVTGATYERALLMRGSLHQAQIEREQLVATARSGSSGDNRNAFDEPGRTAEEASECNWLGADWGHSNARWYLWQSAAQKLFATVSISSGGPQRL